jgi:hypothetical protein
MHQAVEASTPTPARQKRFCVGEKEERPEPVVKKVRHAIGLEIRRSEDDTDDEL